MTEALRDFMRADLLETMREAISERVAGTAMIQACYLEEACKEIECLQTENAELRKDADRYRLLRDVGHGFDIAVREEDGEGEQWVHGYPPEELDAAIDAAMKGGE